MISQVFLFPYYLVLRIRNRLYDKGRIASVSHPVPVISVGNVTAGGTGKTPMVEFLAEYLHAGNRVAVLSRGYKRKTRGFRLVEAEDTADRVGDEPLQVKRKFPDILVAVDKDRNHGVEQLLALPEGERPDVILLDDGFQYRKLKPTLDIVLVDYNRPVFKDNLLPIGRLRDLPEQIGRAGVIVATKSPFVLDEWERTRFRQENRLRADQQLFFATIRYHEPEPVFRWEGDRRYIYSKEVFLFSGVADDRPLRAHLVDRYPSIAHKRFGDHHRFNWFDIRAIRTYARRHPLALLLTTEKDAQRLLHCRFLDAEVRRRLFYLPIEQEFLSWEEALAFEMLVRDQLPGRPADGCLF